MTDWGYILTKPRVIDLDANQRALSERLQAMEPYLRSCIGCGNCTATCTAGAITPFNIRKLQTLFRRGEYEGLRAEIDKCMFCGKCRIACPRGINTRKIIQDIKRLLDEQKAALK
ncbi:MAG: 4Fe-4S dicluster domain-containing protein [Rikenellaceae bacterium]|jgi:heterodisulfide reductase subunit C|nr:4Fe-4S dicluster domain-containing protein [Rikenellaceae bacterium]